MSGLHPHRSGRFVRITYRVRPMKPLLAILAALALHAAAAAQVCGNAASGSCLQVHAPRGCSDANCCNTVCNLQPSCCTVTWDSGCVDLANSQCNWLCGATAALPCTQTHPNPSCSDANCCNTVCAIDPGCCTFSWDGTCVFMAELYCNLGPPVECGLPGQGSCTVVHPTPGCSNATCCNTVCGLDPSCCTGAWDALCVQLANAYCAGCSLPCPTGAALESEACGQRGNLACAAGQAPEALTPGTFTCGTIDGANSGTSWGGDRDSFAVTLTDGNGDGLVRVTLSLVSNGPAFAALVPAACPINLGAAALSASTNNCTQADSAACLPPGTYWVVVAPGTFPNATASSPIDCNLPLRYRVRASATDTGCAPPCSTASLGCFDPHDSPGCNDVACCQATCATDPFCCSDQWDLDCARSAAVACGAPVPANDSCATAIPIGVNQTAAFSTIRATVGTPALPASCESGTGTSIGPDLWFSYNGERSGAVTVSTCGSPTDLRVAVYSGDCGLLTLVGCNSGSIICSPSSGARFQFQAVCSTNYLIRVGGESPSHAGSGSLTLSAPGPVCPAFCPADLNRDGAVDGFDLGLLLGNWGSFGTGDLDLSGQVDGLDLGLLLGSWGACP